MFETLTLMTLGLIFFFAWQNKQLGLTSTVPKEPGARARWQAAQCLQTCKERLAHCQILNLQPHRLEVQVKDGEKLTLWSESGEVYAQSGGSKQQKLHSLGAAGQVVFSLLSPQALFVKIIADSGQGAHHEVGVRLEVDASACSASASG